VCLFAKTRTRRTVATMTTNETPAHTAAETPLDDPEEIARFLAQYQPTGVPAAVWQPISPAAAALVLRAGQATRLRVEKDIQLLGAVVAHLLTRGRPVTLEEALKDTTLLSFDTDLKASAKTRENKRGIHRRLQATHRGLPWRAERRPDGDRVANLTPHTTLSSLHRAHDTARVAEPDDHDAQAFISALQAARSQRHAHLAADANIEEATWARARRYAETQGLTLTKPILRALVTQEIFDLSEPVAVLVSRFALTRRDLDLALTRIADLPPATSPEVRDLLRGS
jgi:hypothetical protein